MEEVGEEIAGDFDRRGSVMNEIQSYERVVEGGKMAADGCRNLSAWFPGEDWGNLAIVIDKIRLGCVKLAGLNRSADETILEKHGRAMSRNDSYSRVYNGLQMMAAGCFQIATGHRGDVRWSKIAFMVYNLRDSAGKLIRMRKRNDTILRIN